MLRQSIFIIGKRPSDLMAWVIGAFDAAQTLIVRRRLLIVAVLAGAAWALFWAIFWVASLLV